MSKPPLKGITLRAYFKGGPEGMGYCIKSLDEGLLDAYIDNTGSAPKNFPKDSPGWRQWCYKGPGMRKQDPQEIAKA